MLMSSYVFQLGILHDGFAGGKQSLGVGVAFTFGQLLPHVIDDFIRCSEPEGSRIADIQLQDMGSGFLHTEGFIHHRPPDII